MKAYYEFTSLLNFNIGLKTRGFLLGTRFLIPIITRKNRQFFYLSKVGLPRPIGAPDKKIGAYLLQRLVH